MKTSSEMIAKVQEIKGELMNKLLNEIKQEIERFIDTDEALSSMINDGYIKLCSSPEFEQKIEAIESEYTDKYSIETNTMDEIGERVGERFKRWLKDNGWEFDEDDNTLTPISFE